MFYYLLCPRISFVETYTFSVIRGVVPLCLSRNPVSDFPQNETSAAQEGE